MSLKNTKSEPAQTEAKCASCGVRRCDHSLQSREHAFVEPAQTAGNAPERTGLFARKVSVERALEAARRLINSHFDNPDKARCSIPANADDDDLVLTDYLRQSQAASSQEAAPPMNDKARRIADYFGVPVAFGAEPAPSPATKETPRVQEFWDAQGEWSQATFGPDAECDHIGPLKHLAKEAVEAQVRPSDPVEIADCLFLVFDAARRSGMTLADLIRTAEKKFEVNKARKWNKAIATEAFGEHVRDAKTASSQGPAREETPTKLIDKMVREKD